jgi:outer membrane immunogenic protein
MKLYLVSALIASCAGVCFPHLADAADKPTKTLPSFAPKFSWTGAYVGVTAGYGWFRDEGAPTCANPAGIPNGPGCQNVPASNMNGSGFIGGVQMGYNYQFQQIVAGVEFDFQGAGIRGSQTVGGPFSFFGGGVALPPATFSAEQSLRWFGTARFRLGYALWDRTLIYATGGLAYGRVDFETDFTSSFPFAFLTSASETKAGFVVGGGVEQAFAGEWSVKIEGLYYDLGDTLLTGGCTVCGAGVTGFVRGKTFEMNGGIVRAGLNYKFK